MTYYIYTGTYSMMNRCLGIVQQQLQIQQKVWYTFGVQSQMLLLVYKRCLHILSAVKNEVETILVPLYILGTGKLLFIMSTSSYRDLLVTTHHISSIISACRSVPKSITPESIYTVADECVELVLVQGSSRHQRAAAYLAHDDNRHHQ